MSAVLSRAKQRPLRYGIGALIVFIAIVAVFTCSTSDTEGCAKPADDSFEASLLESAQRAATFPLKYPCTLPAGEKLTDASVTGEGSSQLIELVFSGAFDLHVRQSKAPPSPAADPAGAARTTVDLYPNVRATFIQINDGSRDAIYHLLWEQEDVFYELQAVGPPLQQDAMLAAARSLQ